MAVPKMIAAKVQAWITALPRASSPCERISGSTPYLHGPKKALCVPMSSRITTTAHEFPERNAAERSYDPSLEPKHVYLSPFLWSPDEDKIVFFESFDGSYHLVTVDLSRGLDSPRIARRTVEVEEVVKEESRGRLTERQIEAKRIAVVDLRWKDDRNVVLRLHADDQRHHV